MNSEWALEQLDRFLSLTRFEDQNDEYIHTILRSTDEANDDITRQAIVVEMILDRATPNWRSILRTPNPIESKWNPLREAALRGREVLGRDAELGANLGENAPELSASDFHPWVWSGASSLWQSGHYRQAVEDAIRKLNAETQNKVGRRDVSETDLFNQAFTLEPAQHGKARLRRMTPDDSKTYKSVQRGAMLFAEGIFAGIRNPLAHEDEHDLSEQQALEYLAALSVLARWVDEATVEQAEGAT